MSNQRWGCLACISWCLISFNLSGAGLEDLSYRLIGEEVHITGCNSGASGTLDIPAIIEGKPVTSIGDEAIAFCRVIENVTIPNSVTTIGADAFYDCDSLKSINVHPDNSSYSSLYGALYNKEKTTLRVVPEGFTGLLVLPESVNNISNNAFNSCRSISEILFKPLQAPAIEVADEDPFWALLPRYSGVFQAAYILPNAQGYDAIGYESLTLVTLGQNEEDTTPPALKLLGSAMMTLNDGETYMEAGVMVENAYDQANGYELVTEGSINNAVPGDYTLTYTATDKAGNKASITRTIRVVDTPPSLTLIGSGMLNHEAGQPYEEQGATAVDRIDGSVEVTISGKVDENTKPGTYILTYTAKDSVGNVATITRNVEVVDTVRPTITLLHRPDHRASSSIDLFERTLGDFKDPGAEAFDTVDGTIEFSSISIIGDVDTTKPGKYELTYTATDKAGNVASVTRIVRVVDRTPPTLRLIGDEVIEIEAGKDYTDSGAGVVWGALDGSGSVMVRTGGAEGNQVVNSDRIQVSQVNTNIDFTDNAGRDRTFGTAAVYKALAEGSYTIEYGASDELSNVAIVSRKIIVRPDVTPPVINVIGDAWNVITVDDIDVWFYDKLYKGEWAEGATAYDAVEGVVKVSTPYEHYLPVNPISERNFKPWHRDVSKRGLYVLTYKATDKSGNSAVAYRKIQVIDEGEIPYTEEELITADFEPPVITLNGPEHVNLYAGDPYEEQGAKAEDAQDGAVVVDTGGGKFNTNSLGNYEVNYYAQDRFGNRSRATRYVHVIDPQARLLTFKVEADDSVTLTSCNTSIAGDLIIPSYWEGKPVKKIGEYAFGKTIVNGNTNSAEHPGGPVGHNLEIDSCWRLENVIIPDSVTAIGAGAFYGCHNLKSVDMGNELDYIGFSAFSRCSNLTSSSDTGEPIVIIPNGVKFIGVEAFRGCVSLRNVEIPGSVKNIQFATFFNCISLSNFTLSPGIQYINDQAFSHCWKLKKITIPSSVKRIDEYAFEYSGDLESVTFEGNAPELWGYNIFNKINRNAKVYVKANATGFGTTFGGLPVCVDGTCSGGGGNTSDGPIVDAVVFFDANLNGVLDPGEPETTSNSWGDYLLDIPLVTYDLDNNGLIDINEGMIVSQGGTDTATGLPMKTTLKGPANATVITPLTTLVTRVMQQNPGLDAVAAADKVKASLEIPDGVDILSFDTFKEASEENPAAADVLTATAKLQDTLLQGGGVIRGGTGKSLQEGADAVLDAVARQVEAGDAVDLDSKGSLKNLLTEAATQSGANLTEAQTDGAASIMEASSKAKEDAKAAATTVTELATEVSRVQAVSQSKAVADLEAVGAGTANLGATVQAYTGSSFEQQVRTEVVGDFTGSSGEAPVFAFQSASYTVNEDGQQQPIIQINRTGDSIESVDLRVTPVGLSATAGEDFKGDPITVRFESLEIRKTLDLVALLLDDSLPEAEETLYLELSVIEGLEGLETSPRVGEQKRATLSIRDNDVVDKISPNSLPTISNIPDQTVFGGGIVGPLPFTISDSQTNAELLSVTASSSDQTTISNSDLLISDSGANRSLLIANVGRGRNRVDITISVRDESGGIGTRTFSVTNFAGQSVIVDNQDAGFTSTGVWNESATTDEFRGSSLFSSGGGGKATFTPKGLMQGEYQVFAWWSASLQDGRTTPRSSQVHYEINHEFTQTTVLIDQRSQSGQWVSLGTFPFDGLGGESVAVSIPASASSLSVSADAIAFVASNTTVSETDRIVDNNGPGFSTTGTWDESGTSGEFEESSLASFLPNSTASWTPTISQPGSYEVYIWIGRQTVSGGNIRRAPGVEYRIFHGDRISSVNVDQNTLESGNWTLIGTFPFSATGDENVTLISNSAGYGTGSAVADAVWFSLQDQANGLDIVYDNAESSFSTVGTWSESGALDEFNGSSVFSMSANSVAMWSFGTIEAGRYQLFVWNSGALSSGRSIVRNNAVRYVIASADGPSLITIDQNLRTGDWIAIGDVNLNGDGTEGISVFAGEASTSADAVRLVKIN